MVLESVVLLLLGFFMGVSVRRERVGRAGFLDFSLNRLRGKKGYSVEGYSVEGVSCACVHARGRAWSSWNFCAAEIM